MSVSFTGILALSVDLSKVSSFSSAFWGVGRTAPSCPQRRQKSFISVLPQNACNKLHFSVVEYDVTSKSAIEADERAEVRRQKAKLEAENAINEAAVKAKRDLQELERLRELKIVLESKISSFEIANRNSKTEKATLDAQKSDLGKTKQELVDKYQSTYIHNQQLSTQLRSTENELDRARKPLDSNNNLDPSCHGRTIYLLHLSSHLAMDKGASKFPRNIFLFQSYVLNFASDGGNWIHGWTFDIDNGSQTFTLEKADPSNRFSYWTICNYGRYFEQQGNTFYSPIYCNTARRTDADGKKFQEWLIGRASRGYV